MDLKLEWSKSTLKLNLYINRLMVKEWGKMYHADIKQWKAGEAIFLSGEVDFRTRHITWNKEELLIMIKE